MTVKKRKYTKPEMQVYVMRQKPQLLQASGDIDVNYYEEDI